MPGSVGANCFRFARPPTIGPRLIRCGDFVQHAAMSGEVARVPANPTGSGSRRSRHASIVDVAALAGVSAATVSRSLRGHSNVSPATRQRVVEAARELSYVISPQASGLASGRTGTVGIVVPFITRWFFANAVAGASNVLREAGYDVLLHHLGSADRAGPVLRTDAAGPPGRRGAHRVAAAGRGPHAGVACAGHAAGHRGCPDARADLRAHRRRRRGQQRGLPPAAPGAREDRA